MKDRFGKLAALTRGAAVVSLGVGTAGSVVAACTKNDPAQPAQPPVTTGSVQTDATVVDASDADAGFRLRRRFPVPNALPRFRFRDGGPSGGADGSSGP
jgi:hypothetical protein